MLSPHWRAVLQALFVTLLWSLSWVLIKLGLEDIPALTFAGLRYVLAFLILLPFVLFSAKQRAIVQNLSRHDWKTLIGLGIIYYSITQGAQFLGLVYLQAVTFSLMLNFTVIVTAFMGIFMLKERLSAGQWLGITIFLGGVLVYFYPIDIPSKEVLGLGIATVAVIANSGSSTLGRYINRQSHIPALVVTVISMGIGSLLLLATGILTQGLPSLSLQSLGIIIVLAVVNTAFAFTLWNHTLRTLSSVESSVINNTMLIQIAVVAWIFLDETISVRGLVGLAIAVVGILLVQFRGLPRTPIVDERADIASEVELAEAV